MAEETRALSKVRIVDLTDERAIYGVKLLADLGADTVRPVPQEGDPLAKRGPFDEATGKSLWYAFHASSRRFFLMSDSEQSERQLHRLCENADVVVANSGHPFESILDLDAIRENNKKSVVVDCTSFGREGPRKNYLAPDLVAGALGGSVAITGDVDTPPLKPFGDLNFTVSGAYVAIAALAGLRHARETGEGQIIRVPVHECIASCLEHVFMFYLFSNIFRNARGGALERRGSLHWTDLYEVMSAKNGHIMVTPTPSLDNQLVWLIEEDAFEDLLDPKYQEPGERGQWARRMMEVLRSWVAEKDVESLFFDAQAHHAPYGWVQSIPQVAKNPQLAARNWWSTTKIDGHDVKVTGAPYQMSDSQTSPRDLSDVPVSEHDVLEACGWSQSG